ncbi:MAG: hemolysin family protein [Robiginitomaculum sp.]
MPDSDKKNSGTTPSDRPSFLSRLLGGKNSGEGVETLAAASQKNMIDAAEQFHSLRVSDVMVPRIDIKAIAKNATLKELANMFQEAAHSRMPVFGESLDEPIGMVHIKDLLPYLGFKARGRSAENYSERKIIKSILRAVIFVPPSMLAQDLLRRMQAKRIHMALVVDEYGGTDGLVTLEDLMEQIVGDIDDEHSDDDPEMIVSAQGKHGKTWDVDARASIEDFEAVFGREIATDEQEDDVDTLGGLVFTLAGRVPERGEVIAHPYGIEFEVLDADARRVKRLRVRLTPQAGGAQ